MKTFNSFLTKYKNIYIIPFHHRLFFCVLRFRFPPISINLFVVLFAFVLAAACNAFADIPILLNHLLFHLLFLLLLLLFVFVLLLCVLIASVNVLFDLCFFSTSCFNGFCLALYFFA